MDQVSETRRVLHEMNDAADRAIDDQVARKRIRDCKPKQAESSACAGIELAFGDNAPFGAGSQLASLSLPGLSFWK
jgi:hypothetical protein